MTAAWLPPGKQTFVGLDGTPLVGGFVHHYVPGTSTRKDTWQDSDQSALNTNPIVLDERGQCLIWGTGGYRQVLTDADGNEIWDRPTTVGFQADVVLAAGAIFNMRVSNNTGNPTTQIDVATGQCRDSTNTTDIVLAAPLTKLMTAVWAAGTGAGGRDSATALAAGQFYHVFVIYDPNADLVDVLFSQSATAPNLPAGYTLFRRIWSLPVLGGDNRPPSGTNIPTFYQWGDVCELYQPNNELSGQTGSTAAQLKTMLVPLGIKVNAYLLGQLLTVGSVLNVLRVTDPDCGGVPVALGGTDQMAQVRVADVEQYRSAVFYCPTNTSGQVYVQVNDATATWALKTGGWIDKRELG